MGQAGVTFGIDATEITISQYAAWLTTTTIASLGDQDQATCSWNESFAPADGCFSENYGDWIGYYPRTCVDWCDANAYCKGVGKRLCGRRAEQGGGANLYTSSGDATMSQWYAACSSGGSNQYVYGATYDGAMCTGWDNRQMTPSSLWVTPVAWRTDCKAPVSSSYGGVYDLSGNVWEWEDSCQSSADAAASNCLVRGGSYLNSDGALSCASASGMVRAQADSSIGFRCCSL